MKMSQQSSKEPLIFGILVFLSYIAGLVLAWKYSLGCGLLESFHQYGSLIITLPLALCFTLASSIFGLVFLPICSVIFGAASYKVVAVIVTDVLSGAPLRLDAILCFCIITPVFFVIAVHGMETSEMLIKLLCNNSLSGRETYNRNYIPMTILLMAAVAAVSFIIG